MTITNIKGKRILFFAPAFFRYENMIADKMRQMGAEVDMYDVRSVTKAFERALLKITPNIFNIKSVKYYEKIIKDNQSKDYDYILIVKCDMTTESILKRLREAFPKAKLCLYLWDSVENIPGITKKFQYFDTLHSFDSGDCKKYTLLKFRPLFFADQFRKPLKENSNFEYDISFLGTIHSDRYAVIKQIQKIAKNCGLKCYWFLYLQSKFIYYFYKITKKEFKDTKRGTFSFEKISVQKITEIVDSSRIVLDVEHPKQTGLTMRTIEMIGMNKKLITTNKNIKYYDFYNVNNVAIVDRNNVLIPNDFLKTPYQSVPNNIYERYSLKNWILEVLN